MNDEQLLRYSRQIHLPAIDIAGQERLLQSRVLIVGPRRARLAGGSLPGRGRGRTLAGGGLRQRWTCPTSSARSCTPRSGSAWPRSIPPSRPSGPSIPEVQVEGYRGPIDAESLPGLLEGVDAVVDASDNFATRYAVNAACQRHQIPLVSGAAIRAEGQVTVFPGTPGGPCYQCLYPHAGPTDETCTNNGVLSPLVGIIGAIQATETLKVLAGAGQTLAGRLLLVDALTLEFRALGLPADPACPVCGC
jgi:molybdopterin/thiamine biosynthesis adenylyltransferase